MVIKEMTAHVPIFIHQLLLQISVEINILMLKI